MEIKAKAGFRDYLAMMRPDYWIKHIFIIPGIVFGLLLGASDAHIVPIEIALGFILAALLSSANYVINEWLDAHFDAHHPSKSQRPAVIKQVSPAIVIALYFVLAGSGILLATFLSTGVTIVALVFLLSGLTYNIAPIRTKDKAYLDVAMEAINNPIRLTLGWLLVDHSTLPPASLVFVYWAAGGFLMSVKRLAEYRSISSSSGINALHLYRASFRHYSENALLIQSFLYAQLSSFFLAVFLIKYRIEYLLSLPLFALLFAVYFWIGLQPHSSAQAPERLMSEKTLVAIVIALILLLALLTWFNIPALAVFSKPFILHTTLIN